MSIGATLNSVCDVAWVFTYVAIIWRGFKDRSLGMPMVALSANISWEAIYSFIYIPPSNALLYASIAWFTFDIPIVWQCFLYGYKDFPSPIKRKNFGLVFLACIAISFSIILGIASEFNDTKGVYTGFGINCMISILYVYMLLQRNDIAGQSIYIAIYKLIATMFAFLGSCFDAPGDIDKTLSFQTLMAEVLVDQTYPTTLLIKTLYAIILIFDLLYIVCFYQKCMEKNINPWARF
ncbi:transmembrane-type terpene cyclase [Nostoc sp. UIC 10890]